MSLVMTYLGLFLAAFAAATILPMQSETLLAGLILGTGHSLLLLVTVASIGNILGACVNWWLGTKIEKYKDRKWFPVSEASLLSAQKRYSRYGRWSLLLSWVPFIGDPLTVMSGVMKEKLSVFLMFVSVAKTGRYLAIVFLVS